jgi:hypothetical protein
MSAPLEPLTPDRLPQQGGSLTWARELRAREHAAGLGSPAPDGVSARGLA